MPDTPHVFTLDDLLPGIAVYQIPDLITVMRECLPLSAPRSAAFTLSALALARSMFGSPHNTGRNIALLLDSWARQHAPIPPAALFSHDGADTPRWVSFYSLTLMMCRRTDTPATVSAFDARTPAWRAQLRHCFASAHPAMLFWSDYPDPPGMHGSLVLLQHLSHIRKPVLTHTFYSLMQIAGYLGDEMPPVITRRLARSLVRSGLAPTDIIRPGGSGSSGTPLMEALRDYAADNNPLAVTWMKLLLRPHLVPQLTAASPGVPAP